MLSSYADEQKRALESSAWQEAIRAKFAECADGRVASCEDSADIDDAEGGIR